MDLGLKGRVAVITGPAKGMGAAVSKAFASEGCRLALIGRDVKAIEPVAKEIKQAGGEAIIVPCDVTSTTACDTAATAAKDAFGGRIDILVDANKLPRTPAIAEVFTRDFLPPKSERPTKLIDVKTN